MEEWLQISKFLITLIAVAGLYIARQQYVVNKTKIRLELYDKRFGIYHSIVTIFENMLCDEKVNEKLFFAFETSCNEARFLLPDKVLNDVTQARSLAYKWKRLNRELVAFERKNLSSDNVDVVKNKMIALEEEIESFIDPMTKSFSTVLKFEKF
ncbi:hypothetical protein [Psychromonas aquimarina]|uniref:hypothetical protein n=1 Tax=Psychromonas aquimarina TaxID=444919 RepID=UPI000418E358|nr:hypothetical protein [Psychromonas aquimarina]